MGLGDSSLIHLEGLLGEELSEVSFATRQQLCSLQLPPTSTNITKQPMMQKHQFMPTIQQQKGTHTSKHATHQKANTNYPGCLFGGIPWFSFGFPIKPHNKCTNSGRKRDAPALPSARLRLAVEDHKVVPRACPGEGIIAQA